MKLSGDVNFWIEPILRIQSRGKKMAKASLFLFGTCNGQIRDLLEIINGCSGIAQSKTDDFPTIFDKKLTFRQLYKFLK